jgi:plasmid maintenance system antidote protein VapI
MPVKRGGNARSEFRHVGVVVAEELRARGWDVRRASIAADCPVSELAAVLAGEIVTSAAAHALARAFGGGADRYLTLDRKVREFAIAHYGCRTGFW